jgi:hypothetical protein
MICSVGKTHCSATSDLPTGITFEEKGTLPSRIHYHTWPVAPQAKYPWICFGCIASCCQLKNGEQIPCGPIQYKIRIRFINPRPKPKTAKIAMSDPKFAALVHFI